MMKRNHGWRRRRAFVRPFLIAVAVFAGVGLLSLTLRSVDPPQSGAVFLGKNVQEVENESAAGGGGGGGGVGQAYLDLDSSFSSNSESLTGGGVGGSVSGGAVPPDVDIGSRSKRRRRVSQSCATVEQMGKSFETMPWKETLRFRNIVKSHFALNGASSVRDLPPEKFCRHGFVLGKASEAGFGNEMYKILNAAALSIMLNRSLIIGQTRGRYPFGDYISYSNHSFTLKEVKHLWRKNGCVQKYGRHLVMRIDDFEKPAKSNVLCSNWRKWDQPIIWFQNTTDAVASQFFLKNVHPEMRNAAIDIFGQTEQLHSRPNVFGELMKALIFPSKDVAEAVNWILGAGTDPDVSLHMRMLMNRPVRAVKAALNCVKRAVQNLHHMSKPRVVLISDTPAFVESIIRDISEFAEVLRFDYKNFQGNISQKDNKLHNLEFRARDWGPAPRWVAFVDFFLASHAKHAVVSGAHKRVGTTFAQLVAALAASNNLGENSTGSSFSFLSSFQSNLLAGGLKLQVGWGHVWNRFAGPLSCPSQPSQCASTPLLPPAWWDGLWQSPIPRDIRRLAVFGVKLSGFGTIDENYLQSFCKSRKNVVKTVVIL